MIYLWVRTSVDWSDEAAFLRQVQPAFMPSVTLWNEAFTMPSHVFRGRVRTIARPNLSRVEQTTCADWDAIPDGAIVLPVDDDGWFAPDAAIAIERDPQAVAYRWPSSFVQVPIDWHIAVGLARRRLLPRTPPVWFCSTNNYAVVEVALRVTQRVRRWRQPQLRLQLLRRVYRRVVVIDHCLSFPARLRSESSLSGQTSYTDDLTLPLMLLGSGPASIR